VGASRVTTPTLIEAAGSPPKAIEEYFGLASDGNNGVSIAVMRSPVGWTEPPQTPEFDEYTVVLRGALHVDVGGETVVVRAGECIHLTPGEEVRYATPTEATEYVSVCIPAFSPARVHRAE
jgi:ethanolamine utilization protein EutQ (cupin superfamily)